MQPESDRNGAAGTTAAPGLKVLQGEDLLGVAEGDFDGPAVVVVGGDGHAVGVDVGSKEEVVVLMPFGVTDDHQWEWSFDGHVVPECDTDQQQTLDGAVAHSHGGKSPAPLAGAAPRLPLERTHRLLEGSVACTPPRSAGVSPSPPGPRAWAKRGRRPVRYDQPPVDVTSQRLEPHLPRRCTGVWRRHGVARCDSFGWSTRTGWRLGIPYLETRLGVLGVPIVVIAGQEPEGASAELVKDRLAIATIFTLKWCGFR